MRRPPGSELHPADAEDVLGRMFDAVLPETPDIRVFCIRAIEVRRTNRRYISWLESMIKEYFEVRPSPASPAFTGEPARLQG